MSTRVKVGQVWEFHNYCTNERFRHTVTSVGASIEPMGMKPEELLAVLSVDKHGPNTGTWTLVSDVDEPLPDGWAKTRQEHAGWGCSYRAHPGMVQPCRKPALFYFDDESLGACCREHMLAQVKQSEGKAPESTAEWAARVERESRRAEAPESTASDFAHALACKCARCVSQKYTGQSPSDAYPSSLQLRLEQTEKQVLTLETHLGTVRNELIDVGRDNAALLLENAKLRRALEKAGKK